MIVKYIVTNIVFCISERFFSILQGDLRWAGCIARMDEVRHAFKILTGRPIGKRPLGKPRHR